jgi:hypothetical protein
MERSWDDLTPTLRKRGRKSAASLSVVPVDVKLQRPEPPARLSAVEKQIWREIAEKVRPGWFWSSEPLLELYVQTLAHQRQLAGFIKEVAPGSQQYLELMRLQRGVVMLAANLAGKLRLTPRSSVDRYAPKLASSLPKPWDLPLSDDEKPDEPKPPAA